MADENIISSASRVDTIKVLEKDVALAITPEPITPERVYAANFAIQAKAGNTGVVEISHDGAVWFACDGISLAARSDRNFDFNKILIRVTTDGDGIKVLYNSTGAV